ncbi:MAG: S46 family peptidase [Gemmatimonadetes bacterium]|nr:S46 family peptidase [Gemmatimonadota bacterium]
MIKPLPSLRVAGLALLLGASATTAQVNLDTIRPGRFDFGRMWTFEYAPAKYFTETYGFTADQAWFDRARMSALRIPGCSASFVSPDGLVVTNHHCIRGAVARLSQPGEDLLDNGFYARTLAEERRIPGYYADQLLSAEDVSAELFAVIDQATTEEARVQARQEAARAVQARIAQRYPGDSSIQVQVVPLYHGGRYSAYTFRRYTDVRLVSAVELQLGFFGGDPDNFTYPRHDLDFGFLRVYGADGKPVRTDHYFGWSEQGVQEDDVVFVIGNPASTNRLLTTTQLETRRDVMLPPLERAYDQRIRALWDFYREDPQTGNQLDLRNAAFGLSNTWKQYVGQIDALDNEVIMARKAAAERELQDSLNAKPALRERYGTLIARIAALQPRARELGPLYGAFALWGSGAHESALFQRAIAAHALLEASARNVPADSSAALAAQLTRIGDKPAGLERRQLIVRLQDLLATFPAGHPVRQAIGAASAEAAADRLLAQSVLATAAGTARVAQAVPRTDPALAIVAAAVPILNDLTAKQRQLAVQESDLAAQLGRARFEVYGTAVPSDGTGSPRIADGVVKSYEYNGTLAPPYTTFYGVYDLYYAHGPDTDWNLPARWLPPPPDLDLSTPLNFISTADTYGGNSGSPAVTRNLELVGLNFDRNIEGLSRNFIFLPERGRNIMVDVRAIREALDDVYDADRIVMELRNHRVYASEAEADAAKK